MPRNAGLRHRHQRRLEATSLLNHVAVHARPQAGCSGRLMLPMKSTDPDVPNRSHSKGGCAATEHAHFFENPGGTRWLPPEVGRDFLNGSLAEIALVKGLMPATHNVALTFLKSGNGIFWPVRSVPRQNFWYGPARSRGNTSPSTVAYWFWRICGVMPRIISPISRRRLGDY